MDKITIPDLNGTSYFIWELKMKAALSLKRLDSLIINEKPGDLSSKDEIEWETKNLDSASYIKLSLADEQGLQFAAEDNAKVLWDKIRGTFTWAEAQTEKLTWRENLSTYQLKLIWMGYMLKHFIPGEKMENKQDFGIFVETQITRQRIVTIETRTLQVQTKGIYFKETIRLEMDTYLQLPIEKKTL
ncbi:retrovirus-related Pol polyprotein from transposon TNT 1-94 [Trichonephila clavipes]|nr:retrovirus-related Pol polyprotein from transposon TNT 1-94 [Trichonephila clavipes]